MLKAWDLATFALYFHEYNLFRTTSLSQSFSCKHCFKCRFVRHDYITNSVTNVIFFWHFRFSKHFLWMYFNKQRYLNWRCCHRDKSDEKVFVFLWKKYTRHTLLLSPCFFLYYTSCLLLITLLYLPQPSIIF